RLNDELKELRQTESEIVKLLDSEDLPKALRAPYEKGLKAIKENQKAVQDTLDQSRELSLLKEKQYQDAYTRTQEEAAEERLEEQQEKDKQALQQAEQAARAIQKQVQQTNDFIMDKGINL